MTYPNIKLPTTHSIRLLHLLPAGCDDTPLKTHLVSCQIDNACSYEALSYVWGEPDMSAVLLVGDHQIKVSSSLYSILVQLRRRDCIRTLWIDAICINQQNSTEKGQQVAMMGQIFQQADKVLCWLGDVSEHRLSAMRHLQQLADKHHDYIRKDTVENIWALTGDVPVPGVDLDSLVMLAREAHVNSIYTCAWFTRLWIVQEVAIARDPLILCGRSQMTWKSFELATRVLVQRLEYPKFLINAMTIILARAQHALNVRPTTKKPVIIQNDTGWGVGRVAWEMRRKNCRDDRDRVYALLSLTAHGNSSVLYKPKILLPDYERSVEWAYAEYWARYGGYSYLFYAGLSRRGTNSMKEETQQTNDAMDHYFGENRLPSWCPELRPKGVEWEPSFTCDYAASTSWHHMASHRHVKAGIGPLLIRGHRFDVVESSLHISRFTQLWEAQEARNIMMRSIVSLESKYKTYPNGQAWTDALGLTLFIGMSSSVNGHPFQDYVAQRSDIHIRSSKYELLRIWRMYVDAFIIDESAMQSSLSRIMTSQNRSSETDEPTTGNTLPRKILVERSHDEEITLLLQGYLGEILESHHFIVTERGYMGLAPPGTVPGDVVAVLGGPGTPFIIRDTPSVIYGELVAGEYSTTFEPKNGKHTDFVASSSAVNISYLMGPCSLQGIMDGELYKEDKYKEELEWETDRLGTIPKPTICLV